MYESQGRLGTCVGVLTRREDKVFSCKTSKTSKTHRSVASGEKDNTDFSGVLVIRILMILRSKHLNRKLMTLLLGSR